MTGTDKKEISFQLRKATPADSRFIYDLRFSPDIIAVSLTPEVPTFEKHNEWLLKTLNSSLHDIYVVTSNHNDIGVLRYDWDMSNSCNVSIFLSPDWRGKKLGGRILSEGERIYKANGKSGIIKAKVKEGNHQSSQMFLRSGFSWNGDHLEKII